MFRFARASRTDASDDVASRRHPIRDDGLDENPHRDARARRERDRVLFNRARGDEHGARVAALATVDGDDLL